jgi:glycosyltransferase involved in cell wall biosynthesis
LKIIHLSFSKSGGAGSVANTLAKSQADLGHDSSFQFLTEGNLRQQPFRNPTLTLAASLDEYLIKKSNFENQISLLRAGLGNFSLEQIEDADVVNLHWIPGQISLKHLAKIMNVAKSVVWTLHDMWPITGGCHYSGSCQEFQNSCSSCPAVISAFHKSIESQLSLKAQIADSFASKLRIVSPSNWLAKLAQSSSIFKGKQISVIPNPVHSGKKSPANSKKESRSSLGIGEEAFVVAFSAANLDDKRKGLDQLVPQLELVAIENPNVAFELILIGASRNPIRCNGVKVTHTGLVSAAEAKAHLCAADVLVNFSKEENLSMSLIEALSAGVPILALDSGGNSDVVQDGRTGYLLGTPKDVSIRLKQLAQDKNLMSRFSSAATADFNARFNAEVVAKKYLELYRSL